MAAALQTITWVLALAGGGLALAAAGGRATGRLKPGVVSRLYLGAYVLMGLSVALFVLRGFLDQP